MDKTACPSCKAWRDKGEAGGGQKKGWLNLVALLEHG